MIGKILGFFLLIFSAACAQDVSPPGSATLTNSGSVTATTDGQIIENIRTTANDAPGITIDGRLNVVVRNVQIHHTGNIGISITGGSHGTQVQNVNIIDEGASGPLKNIQRQLAATGKAPAKNALKFPCPIKASLRPSHPPPLRRID
jgi:hypothetical protein